MKATRSSDTLRKDMETCITSICQDKFHAGYRTLLPPVSNSSREQAKKKNLDFILAKKMQFILVAEIVSLPSTHTCER